MALIRREARPRDPPGYQVPQCPSARPTHRLPRLPHRFRRSVPRPPPARLAPSRHPLDGVDSSLCPRMTDNWPLPCMNKSGPLVTCARRCRDNSSLSTTLQQHTREPGLGKTRQPPLSGETERNGTVGLLRNGPCDSCHSPALLRDMPPELSSTVTTTSGYRRECPRVECRRADDLPPNLVAHTLAPRRADSITAARSSRARHRSFTEQQSNPEAVCHLPLLPQPNRSPIAKPPVTQEIHPVVSRSATRRIVSTTLEQQNNRGRQPAPQLHACCCPARDWCWHGDTDNDTESGPRRSSASCSLGTLSATRAVLAATFPPRSLFTGV